MRASERLSIVFRDAPGLPAVSEEPRLQDVEVQTQLSSSSLSAHLVDDVRTRQLFDKRSIQQTAYLQPLHPRHVHHKSILVDWISLKASWGRKVSIPLPGNLAHQLTGISLQLSLPTCINVATLQHDQSHKSAQSLGSPSSSSYPIVDTVLSTTSSPAAAASSSLSSLSHDKALEEEQAHTQVKPRVHAGALVSRIEDAFVSESENEDDDKQDATPSPSSKSAASVKRSSLSPHNDVAAKLWLGNGNDDHENDDNNEEQQATPIDDGNIELEYVNDHHRQFIRQAQLMYRSQTTESRHALLKYDAKLAQLLEPQPSTHRTEADTIQVSYPLYFPELLHAFPIGWFTSTNALSLDLMLCDSPLDLLMPNSLFTFNNSPDLFTLVDHVELNIILHLSDFHQQDFQRACMGIDRNHHLLSLLLPSVQHCLAPIRSLPLTQNQEPPSLQQQHHHQQQQTEQNLVEIPVNLNELDGMCTDMTIFVFEPKTQRSSSNRLVQVALTLGANCVPIPFTYTPYEDIVTLNFNDISFMTPIQKIVDFPKSVIDFTVVRNLSLRLLFERADEDMDIHICATRWIRMSLKLQPRRDTHNPEAVVVEPLITLQL